MDMKVVVEFVDHFEMSSKVLQGQVPVEVDLVVVECYVVLEVTVYCDLRAYYGQ